MKLTEQQRKRSDVLHQYTEALKNTRKNYLSLLEKADSEEEQNKIFNASFTLQYMIKSHEKYSSLLASLKQDERGLAVLGRLMDKLTIDPNIDLQGFIDEAQKIMDDKDFTSELAELSGAYGIEGDAFATGQKLKEAALLVATGVAYVAFLACFIAALGFMIASFIIAPPLMAVSFMLIVLGTGALFWDCSYDYERSPACDKREVINHFTDSLETDNEQEDFSLIEDFDYTSVDNSISTRVRKTHQPQLKINLRNNFFNSQISGQETLNTEVQLQFNEMALT